MFLDFAWNIILSAPKKITRVACLYKVEAFKPVHITICWHEIIVNVPVLDILHMEKNSIAFRLRHLKDFVRVNDHIHDVCKSISNGSLNDCFL